MVKYRQTNMEHWYGPGPSLHSCDRIISGVSTQALSRFCQHEVASHNRFYIFMAVHNIRLLHLMNCVNFGHPRCICSRKRQSICVTLRYHAVAMNSIPSQYIVTSFTLKTPKPWDRYPTCWNITLSAFCRPKTKNPHDGSVDKVRYYLAQLLCGKINWSFRHAIFRFDCLSIRPLFVSCTPNLDLLIQKVT